MFLFLPLLVEKKESDWEERVGEEVGILAELVELGMLESKLNLKREDRAGVDASGKRKGTGETQDRTGKDPKSFYPMSFSLKEGRMPCQENLCSQLRRGRRWGPCCRG